MIATLNVHESTFTPPAGEDAKRVRKPVPILLISGRLDASTVNILERALYRAMAPGTKVVVVDLGEITYISSSGLRVLLTARRQVRERGGDILLCSLSPSVRDVLNMVGFTALFSVFDSLDAAKQTAIDFDK
jgi:anti-sigma B factor antagonist